MLVNSVNHRKDRSMEKTIFITGAASGIGRETALLFAERGWFIGLFDLNDEGLKEVASEIGEDRCCYAKLDVTKAESYKTAVAHFLKHTNGSMNALFNCAGIMRMGPFDELTMKDHEITLDINVKGIIVGIDASLDALKATPNSCILSMSSASAFYGVPDLSVYSASKFAVRGLTEALNIEFEKYDIRVTDLMPLYVNTPMISSQTHQAGTLKFFGAKLTTRQIAELAWKAVHGKKVHWIPGGVLKALKVVSRLFPVAERPTMKFLNKLN